MCDENTSDSENPLNNNNDEEKNECPYNHDCANCPFNLENVNAEQQIPQNNTVMFSTNNSITTL